MDKHITARVDKSTHTKLRKLAKIAGSKSAAIRLALRGAKILPVTDIQKATKALLKVNADIARLGNQQRQFLAHIDEADTKKMDKLVNVIHEIDKAMPRIDEAAGKLKKTILEITKTVK